MSPVRLRRLALITVVATISFVGFVAGVRRDHPPVNYEQIAEGEGKHDAQPARSNAELAANPWRKNQPWQPQPVPVRVPVTTADRAAFQAALASREKRRAFEGAPPTIPHPVAQSSSIECQTCHDQGALVGGRIAPPMSHRSYAVCTQCHVPETHALGARSSSAAATVENGFEPDRDNPPPYRFGPGSPPQNPHRRFMRERCSSCHGPAGRPGLQTTHPERRVCEQCHTMSAWREQRPLGVR